MLAIVPPGFGDFVRGDISGVLDNPVALANWLITFMFVVDVAFATVGLSAHDAAARFAHPHRQSVRGGLDGGADLLSAVRADGRRRAARLPSRHAARRVVALVRRAPVLLAVIGAVLVALTAHLCLGDGGVRPALLEPDPSRHPDPRAVCVRRHPAYLSKNLFWWISTVPFLTTGSWVDAVRATALMGIGQRASITGAPRPRSGIWAPTRRIRNIASGWSATALVPRFFRWLRGAQAPTPAAYRS